MNKSNASTPPPPVSAPSELAGGKESPIPKVNGSSNEKNKNKKDKKEKKDKPDTGAPTTPETSSTPAPATDSGTPDKTSDAAAEGNADQSTGGARTPKTGKPPRNPWTIFMRMAPNLAPTEAEIRDFFGPAKDGITRVNLPHPFAGKPRLAYVEFGDEEGMKKGLDGHLETLKDTTPEVKQATEREQRPSGEGGFSRGFGGRGRGGRGGPGGGFAARGLSAAGLTRGRGGANGDANGHRGGDA